jgi:hypothetical protein
MFIGTLSPVSNRADWIDAYQLLDEETNGPIDIADATAITIEVRDPKTRCIVLTGSLSGGEIERIETGTFQWHFTADRMRLLCPQDYEIGCTIVKDGITSQLLIGVLPVMDGVNS